MFSRCWLSRRASGALGHGSAGRTIRRKSGRSTAETKNRLSVSILRAEWITLFQLTVSTVVVRMSCSGDISKCEKEYKDSLQSRWLEECRVYVPAASARTDCTKGVKTLATLALQWYKGRTSFEDRAYIFRQLEFGWRTILDMLDQRGHKRM